MSEGVARPPVAWLPLAGLVAAKLAIHAWSAGVAAWGYVTDEPYFLDSLDRLATSPRIAACASR